MRKANNNRPSPPRWADRLLEWFCAPHLLEEVMGDLHERYALRAERGGEAYARQLYWREVLSYLRPSVFRRKSSDYSKSLSTTMLRNYFTIALRALRRNRNYTVINIVGLTFGLTCCLLLFLAIRYELSYDRHHVNANRIYRMVAARNVAENNYREVGMPLPALAALRTDFPDLQITLVHEVEGVVKTDAGDKFDENEGVMAFVEPVYFRLFDFQWKNGNPETSLTHPNTAVLSERLARKYFGNANPIGRTMRVENKADFIVTGVVQEPPVTTSMPFELLLSFASLKAFGANTSWDEWNSNSSQAQIYLMLPSQKASVSMERQLVPFVKKYFRPDDAKNFHYELQPLTDIHFDLRTGNFANRVTSKQTIWIMALMGLFILITACINFINLSTSQAIRRAKEVGIRKVLGSSRAQLVRQFLSETGILVGIAVLLSLLLSPLALSYVAELLNVRLEQSALSNLTVLGFLLVMAVCTTLLAGFYPAVMLSGYQPVLALKGKIRTMRLGQLNLRRSLIVGQFAISQVLIIGTIVAYQQMQHFRSADLGYNKEAVLTIPLPDKKQPGQLESLRAMLTGLPHVQSFCYSLSTPSSNGNWYNSFRYGSADKDADFPLVMRPADTAYFRTYGLELVAGRLYQSADTIREFVVNESFVRQLGITNPQLILGTFISLDNGIKKPIVGVVKDFNTFSLHQSTQPCALTTFQETYSRLSIKLSTQQGGTEAISRLLTRVEKAWTTTFPDFVFTYQFLDDAINDFYRTEERLFRLFRLLAGIAIFIGCLGLYGVVAFMAEARTKEVGIRKVLGASVTQIVGLFSLEFIKLIILSLLIATPVGWYATHRWLQSIDYRINISWWIFALTGILALLLALLTVSFRAVKVAIANPVKSLRTE